MLLTKMLTIHQYHCSVSQREKLGSFEERVLLYVHKKSVNCVRTIWSITLIKVQIENFTNPTETHQHEYMNMMCVSDRYKRDI